MAMPPEERRRRHAESERRRRAAGKVNDTAWRRAWRAANPDKVREINERARRKYVEANRDAERMRSRRFFDEHPTYRSEHRDEAREAERRYRERHPGRRPWIRRRTTRVGVLLVVGVDASECGTCLAPLNDVAYPHPMATTVGHEPPLAVAARDGWLVVAERPEHLRCNLRKGDRLDGAHHAAALAFASIHDVIAAAARWAPPERYA